MNKKFPIVSIIGIVLFSFFPPPAMAEEVLVTGNGADSSNQATVSNNTQTTIDQSNDANIANAVNVEANTGSNSVSDNASGDASVTTGNVFVAIDLANTENTSTVTKDCCYQGNNITQAVILENGTGSQNNIGVSNTSQTTAVSEQSAQITNTVSGTAVTGNNQASGNTAGAVTIQTGDITVNEKIKNKVNHATVSFAALVVKETVVNISGNGAFSENKITITNNHDTSVAIDNKAYVFNKSVWDLVTGGNKADDNTDSNVSILTGDIIYNSEITNAVNQSTVEINSCPEKEEEKPQIPQDKVTPPTETTTTTKTDSNPSGGDGGKGGDVLGASTQNLLPITGNNWFYFALFANVIMLFFGAMLRLRAGRSPNFAIA